MPIDAAAIIAAISMPESAAADAAPIVDIPPVKGAAARAAAMTVIVTPLALVIFFPFCSLSANLPSTNNKIGFCFPSVL